jgi:putative cell wall-binding protein
LTDTLNGVTAQVGVAKPFTVTASGVIGIISTDLVLKIDGNTLTPADILAWNIQVNDAGTWVPYATWLTNMGGSFAFQNATLQLRLTVPTGTTIGSHSYEILVEQSGTPLANISGTFTVVISPAVLTFTDNASYDIPASTRNTAIANINVATGVSGGSTPYTFSATGLPAGLSISTSGIISGTPTTASVAGSARITVRDNLGVTAWIDIAYGAVSNRRSGSGGSGAAAPITIVDPDVPLADSPIDYIYGQNRVLTAVEIAKRGWETADVVILASGHEANLIDSVAVAPLAGQANAPIFLVLDKKIDPAVIEQIQRLGATKAYVVGALGQEVADQLKASFPGITTEVLQGTNRSGTADLITKKLNDPQGMFLVGYSALADAVSAASWAAANNYAILLTDSDGVYRGSYTYNGYILGGPTLVQDYAGLTRYYGADRYATNRALFAALPFEYTNVYFADGNTLVDVLTGAPFAAQSHAVILLTPANSPSVADFVGTAETKFYAFGGRK